MSDTLGVQPQALWMKMTCAHRRDLGSSTAKINVQLNHHLLTAAVQRLQDSKNESVIRGRLIFRASGSRARLQAETPPGLSPDIL